MPQLPTKLTSDYFPGLGDEHVVGMANVGISVVIATLALNTARTDAQVIASPPNTGTAKACGPVVHSLGIAPTVVIPQLAGPPDGGTGASNIAWGVDFALITADCSAVYLRAATWSGVDPKGVAVRVIAIR